MYPADPPSTLALALGEFVSGLDMAALPEAVRATAQLRLLDALGAGLWGAHEAIGAGTRAALGGEGGAPPTAMVIGTATRFSPVAAAYANAAAGSVLCDTCRFSESHPGAVIPQTVLAFATQYGRSGEEALLALVAGYEVMLRIGRIVRPMALGFEPTGVIGPLGCAAAAARLIGLDAHGIATAICLAAGMGGGLVEAYGDIECARNQFGHAAGAGATAALLAAQGVRANMRMLEGGATQGGRGFLKTFGAPAWEGLLDGLGEDFAISRVGAKIHGGCRFIHAPADLAIALARETGLPAERVARLQVRTFAAALDVRVADPKTAGEAMFSMEYCLATAWRNGDLFVDRFTPAALSDAATRALMQRVDLIVDAEADSAYPARWPVTLVLEADDGRRWERSADFPAGEPENPLSEATCRDRFLRMAAPLLGETRAAQAAALWLKLGAGTDLAEAIRSVTPEEVTERAAA